MRLTTQVYEKNKTCLTELENDLHRITEEMDHNYTKLRDELFNDNKNDSEKSGVVTLSLQILVPYFTLNFRNEYEQPIFNIIA